jgi:hypothetical protein
MPTPSTPKTTFLHLLLVGLLTLNIVAFITLLFQYVAVWFPDPLETYYGNIQGSIRSASSVLIIAVPMFLFIARAVGKELVAYPALQSSGIRKWLLSAVLFATSITLIVDLITLVLGLYNGELTLRFVLRVLIVLLVAGAALFYYRWDLNRDGSPSPIPRTVAGVTALVVLIAIITGFFIVGSPAKQRAQRFDDRRLSDLQSIQWQVVAYWQNTGHLPEMTDDLIDSLTGSTVPIDPETGEAYTYTKENDLSFTLCATFALDAKEDGSIGARPRMIDAPILELKGDQHWDHAAGRTCFTRTIDPERHTPKR